MSWVSLGGVLLSQIKLADSLRYDPGFRRSLLQNPFLWKLVQSLICYIVDIKIDTISANLELKLASNNINSDVFEDFMFKNIGELQANSAPFLVFLMKTSISVRDRWVIWDKTPADLDLNNDYKLNNNINGSDDVDSNVDPEKSGEVIPLGDNMPYIADYPIIE